jgi:hypothetical protein
MIGILCAKNLKKINIIHTHQNKIVVALAMFVLRTLLFCFGRAKIICMRDIDLQKLL